MEEMIARWIRETLVEKERAKKNQNYLLLIQMIELHESLILLRDKLLKPKD